MNIKDLKTWATQNYALDNAQLLAAGVKERFITKIKPHLRSIIDKSAEIITATEANNRRLDVINSDVKNLINWGLPPIEGAAEAAPPGPSIPLAEVPAEENSQAETKKPSWYSKR